MKSKKTTIVYREKYNKGCKVNRNEILRMLQENINKVDIELRERTKYSDNTEEIVVSIRF